MSMGTATEVGIGSANQKPSSPNASHIITKAAHSYIKMVSLKSGGFVLVLIRPDLKVFEKKYVKSLMNSIHIHVKCVPLKIVDSTSGS